MFNTGSELIQLCNEKNSTIYEITIEKEHTMSGLSYDEIKDKMKDTLQVMRSSATAALDKEIPSVSGMIGGDAKKLQEYAKANKTYSGAFINGAMAKALSTSEVNASMGKICASPTAGASGILPSALLSAQEKMDLSDETIVNALFTAAGVGSIVAKNATVSGAEGGCQAECGVASAMAAAALVEIAGGTPEKALDAASFALIHIMGLVCDPIAGLVEHPCNLRNSSGVINAFISADTALAGVDSLIPFDEVVEAMYQVGKALPESLRETALGGLAATPSGKALEEKVMK